LSAMRNSPQKVGVSFLHDFPVSTLALLGIALHKKITFHCAFRVLREFSTRSAVRTRLSITTLYMNSGFAPLGSGEEMSGSNPPTTMSSSGQAPSAVPSAEPTQSGGYARPPGMGGTYGAPTMPGGWGTLGVAGRFPALPQGVPPNGNSASGFDLPATVPFIQLSQLQQLQQLQQIHQLLSMNPHLLEQLHHIQGQQFQQPPQAMPPQHQQQQQQQDLQPPPQPQQRRRAQATPPLTHYSGRSPHQQSTNM